MKISSDAASNRTIYPCLDHFVSECIGVCPCHPAVRSDESNPCVSLPQHAEHTTSNGAVTKGDSEQLGHTVRLYTDADSLVRSDSRQKEPCDTRGQQQKCQPRQEPVGCERS